VTRGFATGKSDKTIRDAEKVVQAAEADLSLPAPKQCQPGREGGQRIRK
jgi:hypothetical protein